MTTCVTTGTTDDVIRCQECQREIPVCVPRVIVNDKTYCRDCWLIEKPTDEPHRTNDMSN